MLALPEAAPLAAPRVAAAPGRAKQLAGRLPYSKPHSPVDAQEAGREGNLRCRPSAFNLVARTLRTSTGAGVRRSTTTTTSRISDNGRTSCRARRAGFPAARPPVGGRSGELRPGGCMYRLQKGHSSRSNRRKTEWIEQGHPTPCLPCPGMLAPAPCHAGIDAVGLNAAAAYRCEENSKVRKSEGNQT